MLAIQSDFRFSQSSINVVSRWPRFFAEPTATMKQGTGAKIKPSYVQDGMLGRLRAHQGGLAPLTASRRAIVIVVAFGVAVGGGFVLREPSTRQLRYRG